MKQNQNGKAFEYSLANAFANELIGDGFEVMLDEGPSLDSARRSYEAISGSDRRDFDLASRALIPSLKALEPGFTHASCLGKTIDIRIATDREGQLGDVRDIIFSRINDGKVWEVGISAKNNHSAIKHPRISKDIDFGKDWFEVACSAEYKMQIREIFLPLEKLLAERKGITWNDALGVAGKKELYRAVLTVFREELLRLSKSNDGIPAGLLAYLIGRRSFYKVTKHDDSRTVTLEAFRFDKSLGSRFAGVRPQHSTQTLRLPSTIILFDFSPSTRASDGTQLYSETTLNLVLDRGWQIEFRLHNASSMLEPSLKFDVKLSGVPPTLFRQHLFF